MYGQNYSGMAKISGIARELMTPSRILQTFLQITVLHQIRGVQWHMLLDFSDFKRTILVFVAVCRIWSLQLTCMDFPNYIYILRQIVQFEFTVWLQIKIIIIYIHTGKWEPEGHWIFLVYYSNTILGMRSPTPEASIKTWYYIWSANFALQNKCGLVMWIGPIGDYPHHFSRKLSGSTQSKQWWIEIYWYKHAKTSWIIFLIIRKLYLYFVDFKLYVTLSGACQSIWKWCTWNTWTVAYWLDETDVHQ